ncbi:MAG: 50S ribosomal protein L3 [Candidatus Omnitrophota bacterium]
MPGILGKKIGMTRIFTEEGTCIPVTVIEAGPCSVQVVKVAEKDGYNAVQLGFCDAKEKRVKKPQRVFLKALGLKPKKFVREIRCEEVNDIKVGDEVTNLIFQKGDMVDITGTSKGKGFQGGTRRHGWAGGSETHGSMSHRAPGSIGQSSYPSRVFKGLGMAGHMGSEKVTTQNLEVIEVDKEKDTLLIRGAVPGANGSYVVVRYARKRVLAPREEVSTPENIEEKA